MSSAVQGEVIEAPAARLGWCVCSRFGRHNSVMSTDNGMSVMESYVFFSLPVDFAKCVGMIVYVRLYVSFSDFLWC